MEEESDQSDVMGEQGEEEMAIEGVHGHGNEQYRDDLSGKPLIPELVNKARLEKKWGKSQNTEYTRRCH